MRGTAFVVFRLMLGLGESIVFPGASAACLQFEFKNKISSLAWFRTFRRPTFATGETAAKVVAET